MYRKGILFVDKAMLSFQRKCIYVPKFANYSVLLLTSNPEFETAATAEPHIWNNNRYVNCSVLVSRKLGLRAISESLNSASN